MFLRRFKRYFYILIFFFFGAVSFGENLNFSGLNFSGNISKFSGNKLDIVKLRAEKINRFMRYEEELINSVYKKGALMLLLDLDEAQKQIKELSDHFQQINDQLEEVVKKKKQVDSRYYKVLSGVRLVISDIKKTQSLINNRLIKIKLYSLKILTLRKQINDLRKDINFVKKNLIDYTRILYKINNDIHSKDLKVDDLKLLLRSNGNISKILSKEDIIKLLSFKLKQLLNLLDEKNKKLTFYITKLSKLKQKYKYEVEIYQREINMLQEQKKYLVYFLNYLKLDKKEYDNKFKDLFTSRKILKKRLLRLILLSKRKINKIKLGTGINIMPLLKIPERPDSDKFFSWPVLPVKKISTYFDDKGYLKKYGVLHKAIDIAVPQGTPVYAPANGIVYKVFDHNSPALNWMIIIHKYGYITVYLHLHKILVKPGQFVKRGQLIAISGGKPGTRGAGLLSSGPHLHFEIIKNGQHVDPLKYLDLSVIDFSYKKLPKKYWLKYFKDKLSRNIDLSKVHYMTGKTVYERRINFLKKYGSGPYKDINLWEKAASGSHIDIDLGICIGYAETGLGKHFSKNSKWNVGNVGNNDRGDRKGFPTPLAGAKAIFNALNNKYLSQVRTVDKLSKYGSDGGPIYASDPVNWEKNVIKCLTMIKGYWVPEDYPFRLY